MIVPATPPDLPRFISILWKIVNVPDPCVFFDPKAPDSFIISNERKFSHQILPRFCKVNRIDVFLKQLKSYGFTRCPNSVQMKFRHDHFIQGKPERLSLITKISTEIISNVNVITTHHPTSAKKKSVVREERVPKAAKVSDLFQILPVMDPLYQNSTNCKQASSPQLEPGPQTKCTDDVSVAAINLIEALKEESLSKKEMTNEINELKKTVHVLTNFILKAHNISRKELFLTKNHSSNSWENDNSFSKLFDDVHKNSSIGADFNSHRQKSQFNQIKDIRNPTQTSNQTNNYNPTNTIQMKKIQTNCQRSTSDAPQFNQFNNIPKSSMIKISHSNTNHGDQSSETNTEKKAEEIKSQATIEITPKHMIDKSNEFSNAFSIHSFPQQPESDQFKRSSSDSYDERPQKKRRINFEFDSISQIDDRFSNHDKKSLEMRPVYDYECASIKEIDNW